MTTDNPPKSYSSKRKRQRLFAGAAGLLLLILLIYQFYSSNRGPELPREYRILELSEGSRFRIDQPASINQGGEVVGSGWVVSGTRESRTGLAYLPELGFSEIPDMWYPFQIHEDCLVDGYTGATPNVAVRASIHGDLVQEETGSWFLLESGKSWVKTNNRNRSLLRANIPESTAYYSVDRNGDVSELAISGVTPATGAEVILLALNDREIAVGGIVDPQTHARTPAVWSATGGLEILDLDDSCENSYLMSINNRGICVGDIAESERGGFFLWSRESGIEEECEIKGVNLAPSWINNHNQVVGSFGLRLGNDLTVRVKVRHRNLLERLWVRFLSLFPGGWTSRFYPQEKFIYVSDAFVYENGTFYDLNAAIPWDSDWDRLLYASDINDKGQIIGVGLIDGLERGFLMTPIGAGH